MPKSQFVAVKCKLSKGLFSSERAFEVILADKTRHSGPAPLHYCLKENGEPLSQDEAVESEIDGWVAARRLPQQLQGDQVAVEVPDGEALAVRSGQVRENLVFPADQLAGSQSASLTTP